MPGKIFALILGFLLQWTAPPTVADDRADLRQLLSDFLANTHERTTHEVFWADDLIYTSSSGLRYGKAEILARFEDGTAAERYAPVYAAEDVVIRLSGNLAVVTFRLTADDNGERVGEYFNSGVFRRTDGGWQAFTWQATRIRSDP